MLSIRRTDPTRVGDREGRAVEVGDLDVVGLEAGVGEDASRADRVAGLERAVDGERLLALRR